MKAFASLMMTSFLSAPTALAGKVVVFQKPHCQTALVKGTLRLHLDDTVRRIFRIPEHETLSPLDIALVDVLEEQLLSLPDSRRAEYMSILSRMQFQVFRGVFLGELMPVDGQLAPVIHQMFEETPMSRIILVHEMRHAAWQLLGVHLARLWSLVPIAGPVRFEVASYVDEHRLMRKAYGPADLEKLKEEHAADPIQFDEFMESAIASGVWEVASEYFFPVSAVVAYHNAAPEHKPALARFVRQAARGRLIERVELALSKSEREYALFKATHRAYGRAWAFSFAPTGGIALAIWWLSGMW